MLTGIRTHFHPDAKMAETLSQWIGCARVIYRAKCEEDTYLRTFAARYLPVGTHPPIDKSFSQYKDAELTPWLSQCPSQILRNSATIWHRTYQHFLKGLCGRPKPKNRVTGNYLWLTRELFDIRWEGATCVLRIGTKRNFAGEVRVKWNKSRIPRETPKSIWIKRTAFRWYISFSYDDGDLLAETENEDHLRYLRGLDEAALEAMITPVDRGVARPLHTHNAVYAMGPHEKSLARKREKKLKRQQRKLARQRKGSKRRRKTLARIARLREKDANVRSNFWHQTTCALADNAEVVVLENLNLKNMTQRPKPKRDEGGRWLKNGARAKSGLNRSLLEVSLGQFETLLQYKMRKAGKPLFKVSPHHTSQECACCGHTHPDNRKTQADFECRSCGHRDNADHNAALVIRKRAITLIKDSGTELAGVHRNVLRPWTGANPRKTNTAIAGSARDCLSKLVLSDQPRAKPRGAEAKKAASAAGSSVLPFDKLRASSAE